MTENQVNLDDADIEKSSDEQDGGLKRVKKNNFEVSTHNRKLIPKNRPVTREYIDKFIKDKKEVEKAEKKETKKTKPKKEEK